MMRGSKSSLYFLIGCAGSLACDTLYGLDSPRPALGPRDRFEVVPTCADLPIDPSGLAVVPTVVTLTGIRFGTGLGAESVPVSVRIGGCDALDEGSGGSGDEAAADARDSGGGGASEPAEPLCSSEGSALSSLDQAQFELTALEARGCRQRSPAVLECTLDANGEAAFGVISRLQDDFNLSGYLPICASAQGLGPAREKQVAAVPHAGTARVALAVVKLEDDAQAAVASGASCDGLVDCNVVSARARFQVGVVSRDIPVEAIRRSDFRPVTRDVVLRARHEVLNAHGAAPFLSVDPSCAETASAPGEGGQGGEGSRDDSAVDLRIDSGQRASQIFYLCASNLRSEVEVMPELIDGGSVAPLYVPNTASLPALVESYQAVTEGERSVLFSRSCGGDSRVVTGGLPNQPSVRPESGRLLLECPAAPLGDGGAPNEPADMAGAPSAGAAEPEVGPVEQPANRCSLQLDLGPAGTCQLQVGE